MVCFRRFGIINFSIIKGFAVQKKNKGNVGTRLCGEIRGIAIIPLGLFTVVDEIDGFSRNVVQETTNLHWVRLQKRAGLIYTADEFLITQNQLNYFQSSYKEFPRTTK